MHVSWLRKCPKTAQIASGPFDFYLATERCPEVARAQVFAQMRDRCFGDSLTFLRGLTPASICDRANGVIILGALSVGKEKTPDFQCAPVVLG